jgi:hypothetical protein
VRKSRLGRAVAVVVGAGTLIVGLLTFAAGPAGAITAKPTVVTLAPTSVTTTTATFQGTINPNGGGDTWSFEYGPATTPPSYGQMTAQTPFPAGTTTFGVTVAVTNLLPGTTYDVQLVASNGLGTGDGGNLTFVTAGSAPGGPTVVTTAATAVTGTTATVNGTVNPNGSATTYQFEISTSPTLATFTPSPVGNAGNGAAAVAVSANFTGLTPGTTYYFELFATGNSVTNLGGILSLATTPAAGAPIVVTNPATLVSGTTATLNGTVNPDGTAVTSYSFQFGTNLSYGATTTPGTLPTGTSAVAVSANITGLTPGVTYDFRLVATNGVTTTDGANQSFVANGGLVVTLPATAVTGTTATLNGTVNPNGTSTTYQFEVSTSPSLATFTPSTTSNAGNGTAPVAVSANFSGLTPGTTYYFELVASDGAGGILSFLTTGGSQLTQIGGIDAVGTSVLISQTEFPVNGSAGAVVLARSDFFSDALAGGPLAAAVNGPLLITPGTPLASVIDPRVLAEIQRVLPVGGTVYILGGTLALSPNIDNQLKFLGFNVIRLAGIDEYATAVLIAQQLGNPAVVFEATGLNYFDALSAVPAAIQTGAAILLTDGNVQAPETAAYLAANPGDIRYTIGGSLAAGGADPSATNISGVDLYATSAAVASHFFPGAHLIGAATSTGFADALGGGVFMATGGRLGPLLIVNPSAPVPSEELGYLASLAPGTPGYVFGGPLAVGASAVAALEAAIG